MGLSRAFYSSDFATRSLEIGLFSERSAVGGEGCTTQPSIRSEVTAAQIVEASMSTSATSRFYAIDKRETTAAGSRLRGNMIDRGRAKLWSAIIDLANSTLEPMPELIFSPVLEGNSGYRVAPMPQLGVYHRTFYFPEKFKDYFVWLHADESLGVRDA